MLLKHAVIINLCILLSFSQILFQMTMSSSLPEERAKVTIKRLTNLQYNIIEDILDLSKDKLYQDVSIICQNGTFQSNSFTLAAMFPVLKVVLASFAESDSDLVISIPDMDVTDLELFFESLYKQSSILTTTAMIQSLQASLSLKKEEDYKKQEDNLPERKESKIQNPRPIRPKVLENFVMQNNGLVVNEKEDIKEEILDFSLLDSDFDANIEENDIKTEIQNEADSGSDVRDKNNSESFVNIEILKKGDNSTDQEIHNKIVKKQNKNPVKRRAYRKNLNSTFDQYVVVGSDPKTFKCSQCEFNSGNLTLVRRHYENKHILVEKVSCHVCGKSYTSASLENHYRRYHLSPEGQTKCVKCLVNVDNEKFPNHICQKFPCPNCNQMFKNQYTLTLHIKNLHEYHQDNFYCSECGIGFPSKNKLSKHMLNHKEKQPCSVCGSMVQHLERHMKLRHPKEEDKKFICPECDKRFVTNHLMEKHRMSVHLKLRPYNCRYGCEFAYNDWSNRNAHEKKTHGKLFTTAKEEKEKYKESLRIQAEKL